VRVFDHSARCRAALGGAERTLGAARTSIQQAPRVGRFPHQTSSLTAVCAVDERQAVVGMGRLVGDGRMYCFAVDVVVDPDAQGQGIGQRIMDALEALVKRRQFGTRLDLVAAPDVVPFYRRLGYSQLPSDSMRKPL
jgi:GNAT superfamily N-acetyltransferase